jgi:AcrR family transcriptional regulator
MEDLIKTDGRREAGQRTRERLLQATRVLLAERGDDAITLRDITGAAEANVAAVSYHFGGLQALVQATIKEALATIVDSQIKRLRELGENATVEQLAASLAQAVLTPADQPGGIDQSFLPIMTRAISDPPPELVDWIGQTRARLDTELFAHMRNAFPSIPADELKFRAQAAIGILTFFASGNMRLDLSGKNPTELEQLLVPVLAGALSGGAVQSA